MTAVDHAAEARRNIEGLHDYQSEEGMTDESMLTVAIEAQVHATLALAEQQRIGNIIAFLDIHMSGREVPAEAYSEDMYHQIAEGLGI